MKCPGAVLDPGMVVARLELDDPSRVKQAQLFLGKFSLPQGPKIKGEKLHQVLSSSVFLFIFLVVLATQGRRTLFRILLEHY